MTNESLDATIARLADRAAITELIHDFARCIDDGDDVKYANNFTEDGELILPFQTLHGRANILAAPAPPAGWATHHHIGTVIIDIEGDSATSRAYLIATHVFDKNDTSSYAQAGGWYRHDLTRTEEGWRFARVELHVVWETETRMIPDNFGAQHD